MNFAVLKHADIGKSLIWVNRKNIDNWKHAGYEVIWSTEEAGAVKAWIEFKAWCNPICGVNIDATVLIA